MNRAILPALDKTYIGSMAYTTTVVDTLREQGLNNKSIPVLQEHLDVVRYPAAVPEWKFASELISEFQKVNYDPAVVDINATVDTLIAELELLLWME